MEREKKHTTHSVRSFDRSVVGKYRIGFAQNCSLVNLVPEADDCRQRRELMNDVLFVREPCVSLPKRQQIETNKLPDQVPLSLSLSLCLCVID